MSKFTLILDELVHAMKLTKSKGLFTMSALKPVATEAVAKLDHKQVKRFVVCKYV